MTEQFKFSGRAKKYFIGMMAIGVIGMLLAFFGYAENEHSRFWSNLLLNTYFFTGISLIGMFFVSAHQLGYGGWVTVVKRIPESIASFIWVVGIFGLIIIVGNILDWHNLYHHWTHHAADDHIVIGKSALLNKTTWSAINITFFVLWIGLIYWYRSTSNAEDELSYGANYKKMRAIAATFLVVFGVSQSIGSWTWIMSIDPHWYSTLFGWYNFASYACAGVGFMILILIYLKSRGYLEMANENHMHDLGKFMFGFTVFWTYLWFSQFMLQWYANIPEDTAFWVKRWNDGWFKFLFYFVLFINFIVPFFMLLARGAKRNYGRMAVMAIIVICGHYLDFYTMVMYEPNKPEAESHESVSEHKEANLDIHTQVLYAQGGEGHTDIKAEEKKEGERTEGHEAVETKEGHEADAHEGHHAKPATTYAGLWLPEIFMFIGFIGMFLFIVFNTLSKVGLVPKNDAYLKESLNHHI